MIKQALFFMLIGLMGVASAPGIAAEKPAFELTIKDHKFEPAELAVPASRHFTVTIKNLDATAEEIDSAEMKIEKVFAANSEGILHVRALTPGRHEFIGEYHSDTAKGVFIAQ